MNIYISKVLLEILSLFSLTKYFFTVRAKKKKLFKNATTSKDSKNIFKNSKLIFSNPLLIIFLKLKKKLPPKK